MTEREAHADAVVVGGGFYGSVIATYLARSRGLKRVILVEKEADLLTRASLHNQARVHNGYHYPRSFTTAFRSRINLPRFGKDWAEAVKTDFTKVYAIARRNSKVTGGQFERFCGEIGAKIKRADAGLRGLFEPRLIEDVFLVEEFAFDAKVLRRLTEAQLKTAGIEIRLNTKVEAVSRQPDGIQVVLKSGSQMNEKLDCRYLINCTYSGLNQLGGGFPGTTTPLKHEVTEMALVKTPSPLDGLGITVMDGPFFSLMPFPSRGLQTLSHVRYTPHFSWVDEKGVDPHRILDQYDHASRVDRMIRDAGRYVPSLLAARYVESLFEVKTVLIKNEGDDGRPILFEKHPQIPGCYSILGGKIDNVYDVIERLDTEDFNSSEAP
jgi:glycine/D-amino acid oxidase-like deaminating enzyme